MALLVSLFAISSVWAMDRVTGAVMTDAGLVSYEIRGTMSLFEGCILVEMSSSAVENIVLVAEITIKNQGTQKVKIRVRDGKGQAKVYFSSTTPKITEVRIYVDN